MADKKKEELMEKAQKSPILQRRGIKGLEPLKMEDGPAAAATAAEAAKETGKGGRRRTPLTFTDPREPLSGDLLDKIAEDTGPAWDPRSPTAEVPRTPMNAAAADEPPVQRTPLTFTDPRSPP